MQQLLDTITICQPNPSVRPCIWSRLQHVSCSEQVANAAPDGTPRFLPGAPCDFLTGFLGAVGGLAALHRRATEGGSYHVRVSLARTGMFLQSFPRVS